MLSQAKMDTCDPLFHSAFERFNMLSPAPVSDFAVLSHSLNATGWNVPLSCLCTSPCGYCTGDPQRIVHVTRINLRKYSGKKLRRHRGATSEFTSLVAINMSAFPVAHHTEPPCSFVLSSPSSLRWPSRSSRFLVQQPLPATMTVRKVRPD